MKKFHILIPSLVATASMPLIGLVGCGNGQNEPEPEPVYQDVKMIYDEDYGTVHSSDFDLEKNKYYRIYCTNYTGVPSWDYFAFGKSEQMKFPVKAQVIKVLKWGESIGFNVTSTNEEWYLETHFGYNIEIYLKATIEVKSVCASIVPED